MVEVGRSLAHHLAFHSPVSGSWSSLNSFERSKSRRAKCGQYVQFGVVSQHSLGENLAHSEEVCDKALEKDFRTTSLLAEDETSRPRPTSDVSVPLLEERTTRELESNY